MMNGGEYNAASEQGAANSPGFTVRVAMPREQRLLARGDAYSAALAFVTGHIDIEGDLVAALRALTAKPPHTLRRWFYAAWAPLHELRPETWHQSRARTRRNIEFHYDHDPEFYRQFLEQRLAYSCAYFEDPGTTLEQAQLASSTTSAGNWTCGQASAFLTSGADSARWWRTQWSSMAHERPAVR
jgi:cyclopropane-fatty-acyl-phospholipid synthase